MHYLLLTQALMSTMSFRVMCVMLTEMCIFRLVLASSLQNVIKSLKYNKILHLPIYFHDSDRSHGMKEEFPIKININLGISLLENQGGACIQKEIGVRFKRLHDRIIEPTDGPRHKVICNE